MDWNQVELVSWDLDGTLYDRAAFWRAFRARAMVGLRPGRFFQTIRELWLLRRYRRWIESTRSQGGEIIVRPTPLVGERADQIIDDWLSGAIREAGSSAGVREMMQALAVRGIRQVLVTDLRCLGKLHALDLPQCIETIFEGEKLGWIKPHPRLFGSVLASLEVTPDKLLHIGDRAETDGAAATHHGVQCLIRGRDFMDYRELIATLP
jgi:FMN phosphatase YigB (HAD superfamily)